MCGDMGSTEELGSRASRPAHLIGRGSSVLSTKKPGNVTPRGLEAAVRVLRGLVFAAGVLLGLAFAVACYAEMLGVVQFE
jgi:hypothetical protein